MAYAEIQPPLVHNPEKLKVICHFVLLDVACFTTARNVAFIISAFLGHSTSFLTESSSYIKTNVVCLELRIRPSLNDVTLLFPSMCLCLYF